MSFESKLVSAWICVVVIVALLSFGCAVLLNDSNNNAKIEQLQICSKIESSNFNACLQGVNK